MAQGATIRDGYTLVRSRPELSHESPLPNRDSNEDVCSSPGAANVSRVNSERTQAYGRVMKTLRDLSESKLHPSEQETVREAADSLLFCQTMAGDSAAEQALSDLYTLTEQLVDADRLSSGAAIELTADVEACGPVTSVA